MKKLIPIAIGAIPFGLIMGTVAAEAGLSLGQTMGMNVLVFAGASQLAATDLLTQNTPVLVIVLTGVVINLRFLMYSTAFAPIVEKLSAAKKMAIAYSLTDQSYAVAASEFDEIPEAPSRIAFYSGAAVLMVVVWQLSTLLGFIFGNFAPEALSLDFAVPLAFASIVIPAIKNRTLLAVALISAVLSVLTHSLPYNLGLIVSAVSAMAAGIWIKSRSKGRYHG